MRCMNVLQHSPRCLSSMLSFGVYCAIEDIACHVDIFALRIGAQLATGVQNRRYQTGGSMKEFGGD